jgi:hypothetical protein
VLHGSTGLLGHSTLTVMATLRSFVCACPVFVAGLWRPVLVLGVTHDMVCGTPERTPMTTLIRDLYMHAVYLLTIEALKMCSLPRYLCRKSRIGIAERCVQVAASTIAPADVMLGMNIQSVCHVFLRSELTRSFYQPYSVVSFAASANIC